MSVLMCSGAFVHDDTKVLTHTTILPSQFFGSPAAVLQPEKRLMLAVLENAAWLLLHAPAQRRARRHAAEAVDWVASDETDWPFTFVNICRALGLVPEWIRAGLHRHARNAAAAHTGPSPTRHFPFRRLAASRQCVGGRHRR